MAQRKNRRAGKQHGQGQRFRVRTGIGDLFLPLFRVTGPEPAEPGTLREFLYGVYAPARLVDASDRSYADLRSTVNGLRTFCGRELLLSDLNDDLAERFKVWLLANGLKRPTVNKHLRNMLAMWRYAYRKRRVDELPRDVELLREPKTVPCAWSQEELTRLLRAAIATPGIIGRKRNPPWTIPACRFWPAMILVIYDTGLRIGAVVSLRTSDADLQDGWIRVPFDVQKQKAEQVFRLHPDTLEALRATEPQDREFLLPWPWNYKTCRSDGTSIWERFGAILRRAGLPDGERQKFHKIRRTSATFLADAVGVDEVQKHLGHSHISTTMKYIDPTKLKRRVNAADVIERPTWQDVG